MDLFSIELHGVQLEAAAQLNQLSAKLQQELGPLQEQHRAKVEELKALESQMDSLTRDFDQHRVDFFRALGEALNCEDMRATSLRTSEDLTRAFFERTPQDIERHERLESLLASSEGCGDPECESCGPGAGLLRVAVPAKPTVH